MAKGDLKQKLTVATKGMRHPGRHHQYPWWTSSTTSRPKITDVAREVGVEGRLGGQANMHGAAGTWKDLTDNVNQLAAEPDNPGQALLEVVSAVAGGT